MFVALRNFSAAEGKYFCTGEVVPDQYVNDRNIELGCVAKVKQTKEAKPLTETVKEEPKQILTEDTSSVEVEVTETKKSKKK
jgi:hypothetical protein